MCHFLKNRYTLAVPSFKWFKAGEIAESRMSHRCEIQGPQVLVIGGRRKFADGVEEGCFREPAQVWDLETQKGSLTFEVSYRR